MLQSWSYEPRGREAITLQSIKNLEKFRIFRAATEISWIKSEIFGKQEFFGKNNFLAPITITCSGQSS